MQTPYAQEINILSEPLYALNLCSKKYYMEIPLHEKVVNKMMKVDLFSQWLGIRVLEVKEGYSRLQMTVRQEMITGFGIVHGGITFSFADSAFAFACNNRNNLSVALDVTISFTKGVNAGDTLVAEAKEVHNGKSTGVYLVSILNQNGEQVALFKGTCFRTGKKLLENDL
jgi:acyl-CoA thioesterase